MVEKAFVCAHSLGLDWFKQVLAIVGEGTHQEVFLITATKQLSKYLLRVYVSLSNYFWAYQRLSHIFKQPVDYRR